MLVITDKHYYRSYFFFGNSISPSEKMEKLLKSLN